MRILCTRNIGKLEKGIPPMLEGHVYDVSEPLAEVMFKRGLAETPPPDAPKAEKPPVLEAAEESEPPPSPKAEKSIGSHGSFGKSHSSGK